MAIGTSLLKTVAQAAGELEAARVGVGTDYTLVDKDGINLFGSARNLYKDPTGFVNSTDSTLTYNAGTRTITVAPSATEYTLFSSGEYRVKTAAESIVFDDIEGMWIIYFDENFTLQKTQSFSPLTMIMGDYQLVTMFYWDAVNKEFILNDVQDERHGLMDNQTHANMHYADGTKISGGLSLTNLDTSEDGTSDACAQFGIEAGYVRDEDIKKNVSTITSTTGYPIIKLDGANLWRNGSPVSGFGIEVDGTSGLPIYNKLDAGNWSTESVTDGYYVNYHIWVTTSYDSTKMIFVTPGHAQYASYAEAVVKQLEEIKDLANNYIAMPEYHSVGSILLHCSSSYTNAVKAVIVKIAGGLDYYDSRYLKINNTSYTVSDLVIPATIRRDVNSNVTVQTSDVNINVDTSGGGIRVQIPTIATLDRKDIEWVVRKITQDSDYVDIALETPTDSQFGNQFRNFRLTKLGDAMIVGVTEHDKYYFNMLGNSESIAIHPQIATLTPAYSGGTLTLNSDLFDMGGDTTVYTRFRYREIGGTTWTETTNVTQSAVNHAITEDVNSLSGTDYEVQAMTEDIVGYVYYGDIKKTTSNYYASVADAQSDDLYRYWDMQETSGTDTTATEKLGSGEDMTASGGVTISSDLINGNTIYKRVFGSDDYFESTTLLPLTTEDITILIQVDARSTSSDHTILNNGVNRLSMASDGSGIQLEVKNSIDTWSSATPTGMINVFIVSSKTDNYTRLYSVTDSAVTQRANKYYISGDDGQFLRIGRGTSGDANHQDYEYMNDGDVRSVGIWKRKLSDAEMMDVINVLDNKGMLIV